MKEFLSIVNKLLGEYGETKSCQTATIHTMKTCYEALSEQEKQASLDILSDVLKDDDIYYFYIMSMMFSELEREEIMPYLLKEILREDISLWERLCAMFQLRVRIFSLPLTGILPWAYEEQEQIYSKLMEEIKWEIGVKYRYIPYLQRKKRVVLIVSQILLIQHAPTRLLVYIKKYFEELGYEVKVYVCYHPQSYNKMPPFWYQESTRNNIVLNKPSGYYICDLGDGERIEVYNIELTEERYLSQLRNTVGMIWDDAPEFVFEIGNRSLLEDLCREFTTVVNMNCNKSTPITRAPILARYFPYSKEEEEEYRRGIKENQISIDVELVAASPELTGDKITKADCNNIGIMNDSFVIWVAGNRLDEEISEEFRKIMYQICDFDERVMFACLGNCKQLENDIKAEGYGERFVFFGYRNDYERLLPIGDLSLNPPRQGGGTIPTMGMNEGIPVVTLDGCDVAGCCGKEFICESVEEMPKLVYRYLTDKEFYQKQSEVAVTNAKRWFEADSVGAFRQMCDKIRDWTLENESKGEYNSERG